MSRERLILFSALSIAAALMVSGVLFAIGGVFPEHTGIARAPEPVAPSPTPVAPAEREQRLNALRAVTDADHIYGSPQAPVTLIEYSDFECPFCAQIHSTLKRVVEESNGTVRWVYRHYPLTNIHPRAFEAAVASECIATLAQNKAAFWIFTDALFSMKNFSQDAFIAQARRQDIDPRAFATCMASPDAAERVREDILDGNAIGVRGTPYVVVVGPSGVTAFSGAQRIESIRVAITQVQ